MPLIHLRPDSRPRLGRQLFCWFVFIFSLTTSTAVHAHTDATASLLVFNPASTTAQDPNTPRLLQRDSQIERELKGGESHSYRITLASGQFMRAVVEQRGINVVFTLSGPDGNRLSEVNNSAIAQGTESLFHVAESAGDYRLEVRAWEKDAAPGRYEVRVVEMREATAQDRTRAAAERLCDEARRVSLQGRLTDMLRARIEKLDAALPLWRAAGDSQGEADTLLSLGWNYFRLSEYQKARDYYEQALPLRRAAGDRAAEGTVIYRLGVVHGSSGDLQKQLEHYNHALVLYRAAGDKQGEADVLSSFALLYFYSDEYQKALESYSQSLALFQSVGYRTGEASALFGLGLVYWGLGDYQKSLDAYSKALAYHRGVEDKWNEMRVLDNMGLDYHALGEHQKALECYAQTLLYRRALGLRSAEADTLTGIGTVYGSMGENQKALEKLGQGLSIYGEVGNRQGESYALRNIGNVYLAMKEPLKALAHFNEALPLDRALRDQGAEARALAGLARAHRDLGDLVEARTHIEAALDIIESLRSKLTSQDLRASYFASKRSFYEFYIDLLMRLDEQRPRAGYDAAALQASERARARSLLDLLAEAKVDVSEGIDQALKQREKEIQARISRLNSQMIQGLGVSSPNKDLVAQLKEELKQTESSRELLEAEIRKKHPKYAELKYPIPLSLQAIQGLLDEHTILLEYSLGQDRSFLFVVTRQGLTSYRLPPAAEINRLVQDVRAALEHPGRRQFGRFAGAAWKLHEILIAPANDALKGKQRMLIAPDSGLYYLPFEALLTGPPESGGRPAYLLERWAVSYLPSASVLANLRQRQSEAQSNTAPGRKEFLAFADPVYPIQTLQSGSSQDRVSRIRRSIFDENDRLDLQKLKDSSREATGIARFYRPDRTAMYLGAAAKEESVKSNEYLAGARRIHFATHGLISERAPQYSGLVLTLDEDAREDGLLQVYEIFNLKLSADLVVLSACRTGLGKEVRGEGVIGLTRAFLYAGASTVTVSLWQVADRSTSELMIHFYEQMNAGHGKTEALRRAKLRMIEDSRHSHPFYWAPFILIGEPDG